MSNPDRGPRHPEAWKAKLASALSFVFGLGLILSSGALPPTPESGEISAGRIVMGTAFFGLAYLLNRD